MKSPVFLVLVMIGLASAVKFAPYYDTFLRDRSDLAEIARLTGQHDYHLAFALGGHEGCKPMWGAEYQIDDPVIMDPIRAVQALGGEMIVATGGALGPYLEHLCSTPEALAEAYKRVLDVVGTNHLDVDVEAPINLEIMNPALRLLQQERPNTTVSFTMMIQGEDYGLNPALGTDVLNHAVRTGVRVDVVNAMTMEFGCTTVDFGDCIINTALSVLRQMKEIWPDKSDAELKSMLGITPMIGRNYNGNTFQFANGVKVVEWAKNNNIALVAFWSIERDNGGCSGTVSPYCSGVIQERFDFTRIFQNVN